MPRRQVQSSVPTIGVQHIHGLVRRWDQWFFPDPPAFQDEAAALAVYERLRPTLLPWCQTHLPDVTLWAECRRSGQEMPPVPLHHDGYTLESCRQFLRVYYGHDQD